MKQILLIATLFLSACATTRLDLNAPTLGKYNFNYDVKSPSKAGVIQVFDDGKDTYFKLYRLDNAIGSLSFYDPIAQKKLDVTVSQRNLVLISGLYDQIHVESRGLVTTVTRAKPEIKVKARCRLGPSCHS